MCEGPFELIIDLCHWIKIKYKRRKLSKICKNYWKHWDHCRKVYADCKCDNEITQHVFNCNVCWNSGAKYW